MRRLLKIVPLAAAVIIAAALSRDIKAAEITPTPAAPTPVEKIDLEYLNDINKTKTTANIKPVLDCDNTICNSATKQNKYEIGFLLKAS